MSVLLNTRPLTSASSDPEDLRPLTPNDFLKRPPTIENPPGVFNNASPYQRYRYVQRIRALFKDIWRGFYLQSLADRKRWKRRERNLAVGDFVAEIKPTKRHQDWSTGRVVRVYPGVDGLVRAVDVMIGDGVYNRGSNQLCLLKPYSDERQNLRPHHRQERMLRRNKGNPFSPNPSYGQSPVSPPG